MRLAFILVLLTFALSQHARAQFSIEFSSDQGYADGALGQNPDWVVFDSSKDDPDTFTVDTSDAGALVIDPSKAGFQSANYKGEGAELAEKGCRGEIKFTINYKEGSSSIISHAAPVSSYIQLQNKVDPKEAISFGLRQVVGKEGNRFNISSTSDLNGDQNGNFSQVFSGDELGLEADDEGNWVDGESDPLLLTFSAVSEEENEWTETLSLTNLETNKEIYSITRKVADKDGSFADDPRVLRIVTGKMDMVDVVARVSSITIEPSQ